MGVLPGVLSRKSCIGMQRAAEGRHGARLASSEAAFQHPVQSFHGVPSQPPFKTRLPLLPNARMQYLRAPPPMGESRALRPAAAMEALKCPRCESANTKFCYYNNYNLSQPRHFCKSCRRYWTNGGVLRNVPIGGGYRKSKRPRSAASSSSSQAPAKPSSDHCSSNSAVPINPESAPPAGGIAFAGHSSYLGSSVLASSQPEKVADAGDGDDGVPAVEAASLPAALTGVEWPAADGGDQGLMEFSGAMEQSYNWGCQSVFQTQTQIQWCEMDQINRFYFP